LAVVDRIVIGKTTMQQIILKRKRKSLVLSALFCLIFLLPLVRSFALKDVTPPAAEPFQQLKIAFVTGNAMKVRTLIHHVM
jgi:hypothetical protein